MISSPQQQMVDEAICSRRSIRAFLPTPVDRSDIEALLTVAARAPSGSNTQPWKVRVITGAALQNLSNEILKAYLDPAEAATHKEEYQYYPQQWVAPYVDRRRKVGWDLYALMGLTRDNKAGMQAQHGRNYAFFDAPVGLMFTVDRVMGQGSLLDYGMFLQNLMLAARAHGLHTCPQAAWNGYAKIIMPLIGAGETEMLVCGMSLGYIKASETVNRFYTPREPVSSFTHWID